jgi:hypothetical protein
LRGWASPAENGSGSIQSFEKTHSEDSMRLVALLFALSACTGTARITTTTHAGIVVYKAPPQPMVEEAAKAERPGFVWVSGRWDWQQGSWQWIGGRWEKVRTGHAWREGRWEQRGQQWHWIEGEWVVGGEIRDHREPEVVRDHRDPEPEVRDHRDHEVRDHRDDDHRGDDNGDDDYGEQEPPAPQAEAAGTKAGHVWVSGRWRWKRGQWVWVAGRFEREQRGKRWVQGTWERRGRRSVWVEGHWK